MVPVVGLLLPAIALMLVLASASVVRALERWVPMMAGYHAVGHDVAVAALTGGLALLCVRAADERHAFALQFLEQRYRSAGIVVRDHLPAGAVVLSVWDSGAVRFHGRKDAIAWDGLDPAWLDPGLAWLEQQDRTPYIMVESWEAQGFRDRFAGPVSYTHLTLPTILLV